MACPLLVFARMEWLSWLLLVVVMVGLFAAWDLIFCGGKYCRRFGGRGHARESR